MKKTNKTSLRLVALVAVLALSLGAIVGGTLAYLMDQTDPIKNTFTYGKININLTETGASETNGVMGNTYKMMPGKKLDKDPKVTVEAGSEQCWLYVQLDESENFDNFMTYGIATNPAWQQLDGYENIWYLKVESSESDQTFEVLADNAVYVKPELTQADFEAIGENNLPTLTVIAYAVQTEGFEEDPVKAFIEKDAAFVANQDDFKNAMAAGKPAVVLNSNVAVAPEGTGTGLVPQMNITADTTLDLSGKTLGVAPSVAEQELSYTPAIMEVKEGTLVIDGNGTISAEAGGNNSYGISVKGGNVVINSGKFYGAMSAVQVQTGSLVINGGFFDMAPTCKAAVPQFANYIINCIDANFKDGTATIEIKGGTFVNFDPSANPEGAGTTYVADGYKVVSEQKGSEIWYTVVPNETVNP